MPRRRYRRQIARAPCWVGHDDHRFLPGVFVAPGWLGWPPDAGTRSAGSAGLAAVLGEIGELDDAVAERLGPGEPQPQPAGIDALEQPKAAAHHKREDREVKLIDQAMLDERAIQPTGPVLHDRLAGLVLQPGDLR